jgi:hypothetical protein
MLSDAQEASQKLSRCADASNVYVETQQFQPSRYISCSAVRIPPISPALALALVACA